MGLLSNGGASDSTTTAGGVSSCTTTAGGVSSFTTTAGGVSSFTTTAGTASSSTTTAGTASSYTTTAGSANTSTTTAGGASGCTTTAGSPSGSTITAGSANTSTTTAGGASSCTTTAGSGSGQTGSISTGAIHHGMTIATDHHPPAALYWLRVNLAFRAAGARDSGFNERLRGALLGLGLSIAATVSLRDRPDWYPPSGPWETPPPADGPGRWPQPSWIVWASSSRSALLIRAGGAADQAA